MSRWTIYRTQVVGGVSTAVALATTESLELHEEWMGECYLTVSIKNATPIDFAIGDYIDYRNERYVIDYDTNVLKKARSGTYGEGFNYDNIKFVNEAQSKIVRADFLDVVLGDNQMHYTALPTFPFYCETVDDLLDRIQANLEEYYPGQFTIIGLNQTRNIQRVQSVNEMHEYSQAESAEREAYETSEFNRWIGGGGTTSYGKTGIAMTVDNIGCWDAMTKVHEDFGLNFIIRGYTILVGTAGSFTSSQFTYGKGNGLYEIERVTDTDKKVVTRLRAYGSEENLPYQYYATLNKIPYAVVKSVYQVLRPNTSSDYVTMVELDLPWNPNYFNVVHNTWNDTHVSTVKRRVPDKVIYSETDYIYEPGSWINPTENMATHAYASAAVGDKMYLTEGLRVLNWPHNHIDYATENLPDNMACNKLMLPGFPNQSLYTWAIYHGWTGVDASTGKATKDGETFYFSTEKYRPYIDSPNVDKYGIRPSSIIFDGSGDTGDAIKPTIKGMTYGGNQVDIVSNADNIQDDGILGEDAKEADKIVYIYIPYAGFELDDAWQSDSSIEITDGPCGGRSFKILQKPTLESNTWKCKCERAYSDVLQLYFPYKDFPIIRTGEDTHYVLTGIELPDSYVEAASERLFDATLDALKKNHEPHHTWQPRIDELWMAREHDSAASGTSLHDTIKAGDIFRFADTDLNIDGSIIIDILTIKENGNNGIPTYEISLRNEKTVNTIQKLQEKVDSMSSGANGTGGYNVPSVGMTQKQTEDMIKSYGSSYFLSKKDDDTAEGLIGFAKGLWVKAIGLFGINEDGDGKLRNLEVTENAHSPNYEPGVRGWNIDSNGNMEAETLRLRSALEVDELRINRQQAQEGDTIYAENDQIESVEERYDETQGVMTYILTLKEKWEGYFTAQQYGNILRGKINTLAAKDAGVSDYTGQEYQASQQEDAGGNKYYTSFMQTIATHNTDQSLGVNQIRVVLFGDSEVPMLRNYPPCALMAIARWGCIDYSAEYEGTPQYNDVVRSIKRRQQSFMVLSSDGRIVKLTGVDSPILRNGNYGTTLGILPEFVQNYPVVRERMIAGRDYLYAQGVVVGDFIKIDVEGNPIPTVVDKGEWHNNTPYYYNKFNETTQQYETHRVRHNGGTWQCLQSQPVIESGVAHYYEPKWNSPYWMLVDGNDNLTIEFVSSKGYSFRRGYVDTVITPHLFYGNVDISNEIADEYWNWTRTEENPTQEDIERDAAWNRKHEGMRIFHLTNEDMPPTWSSRNKVIFTCTVSVNDGKSTIIVDNQIIS